MRPRQVALISVIVIILILVVYVFVAKPTLSLPSIRIALPATIPLKTIVEQQNADGIDVRVRTDGKIIAELGGQELAQVDYNPQTLGTTLGIAEKIAAVPPSTSATIRLTPALIPGLRALLLNSALTAYYVLPVELNFKLIPG